MPFAHSTTFERRGHLTSMFWLTLSPFYLLRAIPFQQRNRTSQAYRYIKLNGWSDPSEAFVVKKMLKGFQRINPTKDSRAPITLQMLQAFPMALKMLRLPLMKHFSFQQPFRLPFLVFFELVK